MSAIQTIWKKDFIYTILQKEQNLQGVRNGKLRISKNIQAKKKAMKEEYLLKKNTKKRNMIKSITLVNYENINSVTL